MTKCSLSGSVQRIAAIIPIYNQPLKIKSVVGSLRALNLEVLIVDDGSDQTTKDAINTVCEIYGKQNIHLVTRPVNGGKGAAMIDGFKAAHKLGLSHVFQIDADGQHDTNAIPTFLKLSRAHPDALITGVPVYDESAPFGRRFGRKISNFWVGVNTLTLNPPDSMCGMRIYPVATILEKIAIDKVGHRMDFDADILVRWFWTGSPWHTVPVHVTYPSDGISHFKMVADNVRISWMHTRLFFGMICRLPMILAHKFVRPSK